MDAPKLALITGASSGIGLELAKLAAKDGFALILAADRPFERTLAAIGDAQVETVQVDLSTSQGIDRVLEHVGDRQIDVLCANAGHGLGEAFLDQDFTAVRNLIETNVIGTLDLVHRVGKRMRDKGEGQILFTGSIAGLMPGAYQAAYNASKSFIDSFSYAIRNELKDAGVSVTCLMPGITESDFWERADTLDTAAGGGKKDDPAAAASAGWEAMKAGKGSVSPGWLNTLQSAMLRILPPDTIAAMNAKVMKPGSARS